MRILPAGRSLLSPVCLTPIAALLILVARPAAAVMPPSTCLQVTETESVTVPADLKQKILEQIRKNDERLEQIQAEDRALATLLENPPATSTQKATRS